MKRKKHHISVKWVAMAVLLAGYAHAFSQKWLRCYQRHFTLNGKPYIIGTRQPENTIVLDSVALSATVSPLPFGGIAIQHTGSCGESTTMLHHLEATWVPSAAGMAYPRAEWSRAGDILMHTPGQELFNGVIHPSAGLYEHYFDVDKAAQEHRGYIEKLRKNGIRVHTVSQILAEVGIDSLRALAANVLTYDISSIPNGSETETEAYRQQVLSQMSRNDLIRCILLQPTVKLFRTGNNTGVEAQYIQQPLMNLYFTRDQSITTPRGHVICRMNSSQRAPETSIITLCYEHLGLKPILRIEGDGRLEGGDYIPAGSISFIGCGMRTNDEGIRQLMEADALGHDTIVVVRDHKLWQMQMHLDTHFNIIDRDLCTMVRSRYEAQPGQPEYNTCDIWARKPGTKDYALWQQDLSFVEYLQSRDFQIIPIDHADEMHYANNFLTIAPRHIMAVGGQSEALQQRFREAGVTVEWIPLESLIDGYGAAHCMTQVLHRAGQ